MKPSSRLRTRLFAGVFVIGCLAGTVSAEPLVVRNGSGVSGDAWVRWQGSFESDYYSVAGVFPTIGTGTASDTLTLRSLGATLTPASFLTTSISDSQFVARGGAHASIAVDSSFDPSAFLEMRASSVLVIEFTTATWHAFTYAGEYMGRGEGFDSSLQNYRSTYATLYRVIPLGPNSSATYTYFRDEFNSQAVTEHFGLLQPGRYFLQAFSGVLLHRPDTMGSLGFDLAFNLSPAADPVPEPTTILLLGTGLVGVFVHSRREKRVRRLDRAAPRP